MSDVIDLTERRRPGTGTVLFLVAWPVAIVSQAAVLWLQSHVPLRFALAEGTVDFLPLAILSLLVWRACERIAAWRGTGAKIAAHAALCVATVAIWKGIFFVYLYRTVPAPYRASALDESWMYQLLSAVFVYGTMVGVIVALQTARRERARERREAEQALTARESELAAVKAQLHPHFILNSLNSILALVTHDPPRAREMILGLSELLHATFGRMDVEEIPLEREMELARRYLEIEQIRFADRLHVAIDCDAAASGVPVPPLLLQPLVENAVKHGISRSTSAGEVRVSARRDGQRVVIEVRDTGGGADAATLHGSGHGLEMTRRRLDSVYPGDYDLAFDRADGGFTVRLDLPLAIHA